MVLLLMFLLLAVVRTNYGLWNTDIPLSDEASYIRKAFNLYTSGDISTCLFYDIYIVLFRYITDDPIIAHYCVRFIASLSSVIGLFLLLSSIKGVNVYGAFIMALLWNITLLNTPLVQHNNIHLFTFALACFAGFFWLVNLGKSAKIFSIVLLVIVIFIRLEYVLLLFLLGAQRTTLWLNELKHKGWRKQRRLQLSFAAGVIVISGVAYCVAHNANRLFSYIDRYLSMILWQCYTAFVVARGGIQIDPMTEFSTVMNKQFPGASDVFEALLINPIEVVRYCVLNGISNVSHIYYILAQHSILLPNGLETYGLYPMRQLIGYQVVWFEQVIFVLWIGFGTMWLIIRRLQSGNLQRMWFNDYVVFIVSLAAVSITPLMLLVPEPRYWIMVIPLFFWGPAALISKYSEIHSNKVMLTLSIMMSLFVVSPICTLSINSSVYRDKDLVMDLRDRLSTFDNNNVKGLGYYPTPLLVFAIPGRSKVSMNPNEFKGSSYESLVKTNEYDLIIVDENLKMTQQYKLEKPFFETLLQHPDTFGYELILKSKGRSGPIWIFLRSRHKIIGPGIYFGERGNAAQYQQEGWFGPDKVFTRTKGKSAELLITIPKSKTDIIMYAEIDPFVVPGKLEKQRVTIYINDRKAGEWIVSGPGEYNVTIPHDYLEGCELKISLELPDAASPADLGVSSDSRILGLGVRTIKISEK